MDRANGCRVEQIREAEKRSHTEVYTAETLYEGSTWLKKPVKTVLELIPLFEGCKSLRVLDLGCGVGRNCIPIAQSFKGVGCRIDCVDILPLALEKLRENSRKYGVDSCMNAVAMPLEDFAVPAGAYNLVLAVSALEHVESEARFAETLGKIRAGVCGGGIACLVINSNVVEREAESGAEREAQFEVNMPAERLEGLLRKTFRGWEILKFAVVRQQYEIPRAVPHSLATDVVTFLARKPPAPLDLQSPRAEYVRLG